MYLPIIEGVIRDFTQEAARASKYLVSSTVDETSKYYLTVSRYLFSRVYRGFFLIWSIQKTPSVRTSTLFYSMILSLTHIYVQYTYMLYL